VYQPGYGKSILDTPSALGTVVPMILSIPPLVVTYRLHRSLAMRPNRTAVGPTSVLFGEPYVPAMICLSPLGLTLVTTLAGPATKALPNWSITRSSLVTFEAMRVGSTPLGTWPHSSISIFQSSLVPVLVQYIELLRVNQCWSAGGDTLLTH
jgi:hypothetical protein